MKTRLIIEAKAGVFGQYGWKRISFWKWLMLFPDHVTRIRLERINIDEPGPTEEKEKSTKN